MLVCYKQLTCIARPDLHMLFLRRLCIECLYRLDMYCAGRSYAGKYVPLLGQAILEGNQDGATPSINLQACMFISLVSQTILVTDSAALS